MFHRLFSGLENSTCQCNRICSTINGVCIVETVKLVK